MNKVGVLPDDAVQGEELDDEASPPPRTALQNCAHHTFSLLSEPDYKTGNFPSGACVFFTMNLIVVASIVALILETENEFHQSEEWSPKFKAFAIFYNLVFTLDYLVRFVCSPNWCAFAKDALNIVDVLAILPFWMDVIADAFNPGQSSGGATGLLSLFRLLRLFRLFKLFKNNPDVDMLVNTLVESKIALYMLTAAIIVIMALSGCLMYNLETMPTTVWDADSGAYIMMPLPDTPLRWGTEGEPSPYGTIPACFWWAVITITTVGYGDAVSNSPDTTVGQLIGTLTVLGGIVVLALPITVISQSFVNQYSASRKAKADAQCKRLDAAAARGVVMDREAICKNKIERCLNRHTAVMLKRLTDIQVEACDELVLEVANIVSDGMKIVDNAALKGFLESRTASSVQNLT